MPERPSPSPTILPNILPRVFLPLSLSRSPISRSVRLWRFENVCKEEFIAAVKFEPRICSNIGIFVEHEFMNIGLKWTICMWGLRNNEQIVRGKSQVGFRRAIYKSWKAENSRIRLPRARNSVTTRSGGRSGGREYLARGQTSKHTSSTHTRAHPVRGAYQHQRQRFLRSNQWLEWLALDVEPNISSPLPRPLRLSFPSLPNPQDSLWSPLDRLSSSREVQA